PTMIAGNITMTRAMAARYSTILRTAPTLNRRYRAGWCKEPARVDEVPRPLAGGTASAPACVSCRQPTSLRRKAWEWKGTRADRRVSPKKTNEREGKGRNPPNGTQPRPMEQPDRDPFSGG